MKALIRLVLIALFIPAAGFAQEAFLAGTSEGLYRIDKGSSRLIWKQKEVRKIIKLDSSWFFLTAGGVFTSSDLITFESRNNGLPQKVVKIPTTTGKEFAREVQELKDLEIHPTNPRIMVSATRDAVFLTRDGGLTWKSEGLSARTAGVKAVCVLDLPDARGTTRLTILMTHPIYGVSWKQPDATKPAWVDINKGLEAMPTIRWPDEVADVIAVSRAGSVEVYASQTFMPRLYRLNWAANRFDPIWSGSSVIDSAEGLASGNSSLLFAATNTLMEIPFPVAPATPPAPVAATAQSIAPWAREFSTVQDILLSAWIPSRASGGRGAISLSELWLLNPSRQIAAYTKTADKKKGTYIPIHQITTDEGLNGHLDTIVKNGLNMLVVDMKDDKGFIRYDAADPLVVQKGKKGKGLELDSFVKKAKEKGIYLVARIVVFKDPQLHRWGSGKYAIWDRREAKPWQGYELVAGEVVPATTDSPTAGTEATAEKVRKYYDEFWVDPYSEEVWQYNVAVAKELIARGFDEIQFDYIRFPTDGVNLSDAQFRWQESGMDKESALMSFLSYARSQITAPISIDIYGANGWYRTGARTGQDVELLARYVDVICPMFYPSHFEQSFLAHKPAQDRPYRIFLHGSFRNAIIARNHIIVRPWLQAFYLNVSYDRIHYNPDYVQRQVFGTRDSLDQGYTYWNNSGRYGDLRPDVNTSTPYPWDAPETKPVGQPPFFKTR